MPEPGRGSFTVRLPSHQRVMYDFEHYDFHIIAGGVLNIIHYPDGYDWSPRLDMRVGGVKYKAFSPHGGYLSVEVDRCDAGRGPRYPYRAEQ